MLSVSVVMCGWIPNSPDLTLIIIIHSQPMIVLYPPLERFGDHPLNYVNTDVEDIFARVDENNSVPEDVRQLCEVWLCAIYDEVIALPFIVDYIARVYDLDARCTKLESMTDDDDEEEYSEDQEAQDIAMKAVVESVSKRMMKSTRKPLPRKNYLLATYLRLIRDGRLKMLPQLHKALVTRPSRSLSGILSITVLTSPHPTVVDPETGESKKSTFSCKWDCHYCPSEPGQPKSYLRDEPAVLRANENQFDPVLQFCDRLATLTENGHPPDKIELLVLGGTWSSYPHQYQELFIRDLFYAANTFWDRGPGRRTERLSILEEQRINETASVKIIGITLETRPDCINEEELRRFRYYGCTRVQLGVQHTNDEILELVNRKCTTAQTMQAIRLLKESCYKVDIHLMPNLPGSTPDIDREMFRMVTNDENLQVDQWKIYPCEITPWTVIKKWHDEGKYIPYSNKDLMEVVIEAKSNTKPWVRLNRVLRDIPTQYQIIDEHVLRTDWREEVATVMKSRGLKCRCIRCREIRGKPFTSDAVTKNLVKLRVREYKSSGGNEYFISYEIGEDDTLIGFCRLRLSDHRDRVFNSLDGCALIRELHVYGKLIPTRKDDAASILSSWAGASKKKSSQHFGFGSKLLFEAERIAKSNGFRRIAVISGVGVKNYYRKVGFKDTGPDGYFLIKEIHPSPCWWVHRAVWYAIIPVLLSIAVAAFLAVSIDPASIRTFAS